MKLAKPRRQPNQGYSSIEMRSENLAPPRSVIITSVAVVVYKIDFHHFFPPNNILPTFKFGENIE